MVESLKIATFCSENYVAFLIKPCLNVKHLFVGDNNAISDATWIEILNKNSLSRLETISIHKCGPRMTMVGVDLLIHHCSKLRVLKDLTYFSGIHPNEIKILQLRIREENMDLSLDDKDNLIRDPSDPSFTRSVLDSQVGAIKDFFEPSINCAKYIKCAGCNQTRRTRYCARCQLNN